ncbi:sodium:solute symporter family protein [Virgibacillus litoralis]|uniref:SSS family solute:Na+ symporter n=1 Tax=Virgibacillus litoralis TaxID=578221 RepID=A0ABS4HCK8_9BACI|nr:sodium:solute symporter family protein [Virgibacillus litoralis]MBP1948374.1 SSS family solute:Na+ symporter [Virgibacillus litoralis]
MGFNTIFIIYFVIFFMVLLYGGLITRKWVNNSNDYLLAGREVGLIVNIFGVAAIGFAGTIITLGPGLAVMYGFWGSYGFGFAYLIGGLALYGVFFAPYIRRSGAHTLPEWLEMRFDSRTRVLVTIASILGLLGIMANNVVSMAIVVNGFTGWSLIATLSVIFFLFLFFTYIGGFWAVTLTDFVQMCIGLIALPAMLISLLIKFGGPSFIRNNWPSDLSYWAHGFTGGQLSIFSLQYPSLLTFAILFACFLVWGNNYYWLRVSSTRSEKTAKRSFIYAAILLATVPYLILTFSGIYAGSAFSDMFAPNGSVSPMAAFGVVLQGLPIAIAALALMGSLAASISTSTTALIGASGTAVRDVYQRFMRPKATPEELTLPSKLITVGLGILVWFLCFYPGGPLYLFAFATAWLGPPSVLVFLGIWWKRTSKQGAFYGAVLGIGVTALFTLLDLLGIFSIDQYTHVGVVGLVITVVSTITVSLMTTPNYYGKVGWELNEEPADSSFKPNEHELQVLKLISNGYNTMAEVSDMLGVDSSISNKFIEGLDQNRLIYRDKHTGPGFYTFNITNAGLQHVKVVADTRDKFEEKVTMADLIILQKVDSGIAVFNQYIKEQKMNSLKASVIISKLIKQGYLNEGGLWKRKINISEEGKTLLDKYDSKINQVIV